MKRKYMKESTAWAAVAHQLQHDDALPKLPYFDSARCLGLCAVVDRLVYLCEVSQAIGDRMGARIQQHIAVLRATSDDDVGGYFAPTGEVEPRIIAAQLLALEAKEDEQREVRA